MVWSTYGTPKQVSQPTGMHSCRNDVMWPGETAKWAMFAVRTRLPLKYRDPLIPTVTKGQHFPVIASETSPASKKMAVVKTDEGKIDFRDRSTC